MHPFHCTNHQSILILSSLYILLIVAIRLQGKRRSVNFDVRGVLYKSMWKITTRDNVDGRVEY